MHDASGVGTYLKWGFNFNCKTVFYPNVVFGATNNNQMLLHLWSVSYKSLSEYTKYFFISFSATDNRFSLIDYISIFCQQNCFQTKQKKNK